MLVAVFTVINFALAVLAFVILIKTIREIKSFKEAVDRNTHSLATLVEQLKPQRSLLKDAVIDKFHDSKPENLFKDVVIDKAIKIETDDDETSFDRIEAGRSIPDNTGEFKVITPDEIKALKTRTSPIDSDSSVVG